ncbi:heterokaryon incompatibility protein-domain-containing protein [Aspergillus tamarii]|uniref:Heterokaryon incompatibility protein-domain-containing protein n=1 Tax=Aspergillus tamarii TaxID=41984 RepID=A0A5N6V247_ASPTM|nr:heterokaryon incompatibility protein-domain-containing protein [Aspergillus tamarii]
MSERFEYDPLPEPTCIRLVSFVPQDDTTRTPPLTQGEPLLQLSLCTVDLRDAPHYEALSYTWGSPFPPEDPRSSAYEDENNQQRVLVNGCEHEIGRNLWEFLHQQQQTNAILRKEAAEILAAGLDTHGRTPLMRATALHYAVPSIELLEPLVYHGADIYARTQEGKTPLDNADDEVVALIKSVNNDLGGKARPRGLRLSAQKPMWIDSISINQKDTAERNKQVAMMSDIYSKAMSVVVWLGVEDERIPLALEPLGRDPEPWLVFTQLRDLGFRGPNLGNAMKGHYSTKRILDTLSVMKLMERTWWSRTWVIQELALAKRILIICGSIITHPIRTAAILTSLSYMSSPVILKQGDGSIADPMAIFESARFSGIHGIEALMLADISFRTSAYTRVRQILVETSLKPTQGVPSVSWGRRLSLQNLGRLSWWSQSSDPRDKIFALVGIAHSDPQGQRIDVDYNIRTDEVFVQYGHLFIKGSPEPMQDLCIDECYFFEPLEGLSYVQDTPKPHPKFQDYKVKLPSWTPNFSAHLATCRIWSQELSAAKDIANTPAILAHSDPRILCVNGHMVDSIVAIEPTQHMGDVQEPEVMAWLELIQPLHSSYHGGGSCVDALRQALVAGKQSQNNKRVYKTFRDFMKRKLCQHPIDPRLESILPLLRTSDAARNTLPSFEELLKEEQTFLELKQTLQRLVQHFLTIVQCIHEPVQEKKQRLLELEQGAQEVAQEIQEEQKKPQEKGEKQEELMQMRLKVLQEAMEKAQETLNKGQEELRSLQEFYIFFKRYYRSRCLFRTKKGYMGLGPLGVQPGDEVWLFATARTPFVLRRPSEGCLRKGTLCSNSSTAECGCRTFIGEAYVHGIMNGEAMRKGDFRPVSLV